jgi:nucleotidyltransferase-like protein
MAALRNPAGLTHAAKIAARGEATRDSDIDLLVVVDDDTPPEKLTSKSGYEAHRSGRDADVFPMRAETFERERNIVNTLAARPISTELSFMAPRKDRA